MHPAERLGLSEVENHSGAGLQIAEFLAAVVGPGGPGSVRVAVVGELVRLGAFVFAAAVCDRVKAENVYDLGCYLSIACT